MRRLRVERAVTGRHFVISVTVGTICICMNLLGPLVSVTKAAATETPREGQDKNVGGQERGDRWISGNALITFPYTGLPHPAYL